MPQKITHIIQPLIDTAEPFAVGGILANGFINRVTDTLQSVTGLITAASGVFLLLVGPATQWLRKYFRQRATRALQETLGRKTRIADSMDIVAAQTGASRILLLNIHNGGGAIDVRTPLYGTIVQEWTTLGSMKEGAFQRRELDGSWIAQLRAVLDTRQFVWVEQNATDRSSQLGATMRADGISSMAIGYITDEGTKAINVVALSFKEQPGATNENLNEALFQFQNRVQNAVRPSLYPETY
jgi:hypothetical protein